MTTEHRQPQLLLPPPSPLCNVDVGSDACQETVRDPKNNTESGGGGGGDLMVCLFIIERTWKANFLIGFVHVRLVVFQIISSLKVSTVHEPCLVSPVVVSISNVCDDIMVCFCGL